MCWLFLDGGEIHDFKVILRQNVHFFLNKTWCTGVYYNCYNEWDRYFSSSSFFQSTAQLQYAEDSEPVTRSTWPLVNIAKTEMQVQEEMDKKRFFNLGSS